MGTDILKRVFVIVTRKGLIWSQLGASCRGFTVPHPKKILVFDIDAARIKVRAMLENPAFQVWGIEVIHIDEYIERFPEFEKQFTKK